VTYSGKDMSHKKFYNIGPEVILKISAEIASNQAMLKNLTSIYTSNFKAQFCFSFFKFHQLGEVVISSVPISSVS
jgi:hypothetical protein